MPPPRLTTSTFTVLSLSVTTSTLPLNISTTMRGAPSGVNDCVTVSSAVNGLMLMLAPQADSASTAIMSVVRNIILRNMVYSP